MWVFDGEEWILEDGSLSPKTAKDVKARPRPHEGEFVPELQIVEVPRPRDPEPPPIFPFVIP